MFHFLSRSVFPTTRKLVLLQNQNYQQWISLKFISTPSKGNSFTASYLIDTCGLSPQRAASFSKRMKFETREKPDLVFEFFKNQGFSQTMALIIIQSFPGILRSDPIKTLLPKIDFLKSKGFSNSDIYSIIRACPSILNRSLHREIIPCFDFFNNLFHCKHKFMKTIKRYSGILVDLENCSELNIKVLREGGVPESHIIRFIEYFPRTLKFPHKRFKELVQEVKELGFDPLKLQFVVVVHIKLCISKSTWARKEGVYRKWGWTDDDISATFRVFPFFISVSDKKIDAVMDFLVNRLGYKSADIARCPAVMSMSLGNRIIPRGSVVLVLLSKGLVSKLSLGAIFKCNEKVFLDKFISCHEKEADELLKLYRAKLTLTG
ncbi:uncharacterized protein LOC133291610 [Gastrolobium bilobum]|uniref:uncharacterized protein LOC133291610 n=1 Tax=Gastrolobium bilobum TaxID=150636 RepID=UPI002AB1E09D|nr:uncharacterized protein LOC133291610 [Gastrolobium bilobum]